MFSIVHNSITVDTPRFGFGFPAPKRIVAWWLAAFVTLMISSTSVANDANLWAEYKKRFIQSDGRVIDYPQNQISHSEGQGYGMLLALAFNDRATFERLAGWTANNLQVRSDALHAWSWGKRFNGNWNVLDYNNATDGDLLIAGALLKAATLFQKEHYRKHALEIIKSVRTSLAMQWGKRIFLLPGYTGFVRKDHFLLNPSYLLFSLYRDFANVDERPFWDQVYTDGLYLVEQSLQGKFRLPADWLRVEPGGITMATARSPYFGYEAIRTLLYLAWAGDAQRLAGIQSFLRWCETIGYIPTKVNLIDGTASEDKAPAGFYAIYAMTAKQLGDQQLSETLWEEARTQRRAETNDYYSFSLFLLAANPPP